MSVNQNIFFPLRENYSIQNSSDTFLKKIWRGKSVHLTGFSILSGTIGSIVFVQGCFLGNFTLILSGGTFIGKFFIDFTKHCFTVIRQENHLMENSENIISREQNSSLSFESTPHQMQEELNKRSMILNSKKNKIVFKRKHQDKFPKMKKNDRENIFHVNKERFKNSLEQLAKEKEHFSEEILSLKEIKESLSTDLFELREDSSSIKNKKCNASSEGFLFDRKKDLLI